MYHIMRKEPFFVGDFVHVFNRGNRKQEIVRDDLDRWRFMQALFYFNDEHAPPNLFRTLHELWKSDFYRKLEWPREWPERNHLVKVHSFILMDNHYHLILEEIKEGGVTRFMRKLGTGVTNRFNTRYKETGRLFQGAYKARRINDDNYLRYLAVYIMVKNAFELFPGGFSSALENFDDAFEFALNYPYSSLVSYADGGEVSPAIDTNMLKDAFPALEDLKQFAQGCMESVYFDEKSCLIEA